MMARAGQGLAQIEYGEVKVASTEEGMDKVYEVFSKLMKEFGMPVQAERRAEKQEVDDLNEEDVATDVETDELLEVENDGGSEEVDAPVQPWVRRRASRQEESAGDDSAGGA